MVQPFTLDDRWRWRIRRTGDHLQIIVPVITLLVILWGATDLLVPFLLSWLLNTLLTHGIKYLTNRRRPMGGPRSFPSGHTASAVHGAAFMFVHVSPVLALPLVLAAVFVGLSRVLARKHFVGDVVMGAVLGIGTAIGIVWLIDMPPDLPAFAAAAMVWAV